ncbi:MAG: hypothetical protein IJ877_06690 [Candidatus Gastranaerophilales bacterium]|nr:hypothetical protein [Candidatus Gastranaerophilales bacterium]
MKLSSVNNTPSFKALDALKAAGCASAYFAKYVDKGTPSALGFLKTTQMSPDAVFKFLCHSTSSDVTSFKIVKELSSNPRRGEVIKNSLIKKMNGQNAPTTRGYDMFMTWFHDERVGYRSAYARYYNENIWNKAQRLEDILTQSPNIAPWEMSVKATSLGGEFIFGEVPSEFGSIKKYRKLIDRLKHSDFFHTFVRARNFEAQNLGNDSMLAATNTNEYLKKLAHPSLVYADNMAFSAEPLVQSFSSKLVYILVPENDKTQRFVLKFDPYEMTGATDKAAKFTENQALRPDMPYLDAMVDFYLKGNKSPNAPDVLLYDHLSKSVLYRATEGTSPVIPQKYLNNVYTFMNYGKIADIKRLGVELSDVHPDNFKVTPEGVFKLIDSGHVKYSNVFRPPVVAKHIVTGNLCGRELCK